MFLHFQAPQDRREAQTLAAAEQLRSLQLKTVHSRLASTTPCYEAKTDTVAIAIEVPEEGRRQAGSLADHESDFWKIYAAMVACGFGDVYYEAVDWRD